MEDSESFSNTQTYSKSIGPVSLTATITNILLSTAPFSLPYALVNGGLILGLGIFLFFSFLAFITADMMVEALGVASALQNSNNECEFRPSKEDIKINYSPYFITKKIEIFGLVTVNINF